MKLLSFDPSEPGVFAIGQQAVGIIALGQMSFGVVAVGQLAGGVIAVGQLSIGLITVAQIGVGVFYGFGGVVAARCFRGIGLSLWPLWSKVENPEPKKPKIEHLPTLITKRDEGWIEVTLVDGRATLDDELLELEFTKTCENKFQMAFKSRHNLAYLKVQPKVEIGDGGSYRLKPERTTRLRVTEVVSFSRKKPRWVPQGKFTSKPWLLGRALVLLGLAAVWYYLVGVELHDILFSSDYVPAW